MVAKNKHVNVKINTEFVEKIMKKAQIEKILLKKFAKYVLPLIMWQTDAKNSDYINSAGLKLWHEDLR